ncbi:MAG: hypothetical protein WCJ33_04725 [Pseudomonadota bacterium]
MLDKEVLDAKEVYLRIREQYSPELQRAYQYIKHQYLESHPFENWKDRKDAKT